MNTATKNAVESALVALLVAACCLWFLISAANAEGEPPAALLTFLSLGIGAGLVAHWVFMGQALKRSGRRLLPWMLALVLLPLLATVALLVLLYSTEDKQIQA
jgi:H+/Cl- antiporter ClcA